jgi:hypothetical protein
MAFTTKTRYGAMPRYDDSADIESIVEDLVHELETEQFDEPDDEHYQVAVCFGDWAVTVFVSGLLCLDNLSDITGKPTDVPSPSLYLRANDRSAVIGLLCQLARGEVERVRSTGWMPRESLPPYQSDFFRRPPAEDDE